MRLAAGALLTALFVPLSAAASESPLALYLAGHYAQAETAGVAENDEEGFAIAARAVLADELMRDAPCLDCLKRAEDLARRAIAADPKQPEGHIYLAAAIGYEAHIIGDFAAQSKGYAGEAKRELDAAVANDPKDPWALAGLGSWHIQVVRSAGPTLARWLFGAEFTIGQDYYAKALAIAPDNLLLHYQYALALADFDLSGYRGEIEDELTRAVGCAPGSDYEAFAKTRAQELLDTLKRGDLQGSQRLVRRDQGYPA